MNAHVKTFFRRGLTFGGFGPIIAGIVFFIISLCGEKISIGASEMLLAIVSTYLLAFLHAGASVFNQIEEWPTMKSLLCHFSVLYSAYTLCYLLNSWIPFNLTVIAIYTGIFIAVYLVIWAIVLLSVRSVSRKLNKSVKGR